MLLRLVQEPSYTLKSESRVPVVKVSDQDMSLEGSWMALVGHWTCDPQVMGSSPSWAPLHIGLRQATYVTNLALWLQYFNKLTYCYLHLCASVI